MSSSRSCHRAAAYGGGTTVAEAIMPTLGPRICKHDLHWAIWIPRKITAQPSIFNFPSAHLHTHRLLGLRAPGEGIANVHSPKLTWKPI